jgi:hypothetical protein
MVYKVKKAPKNTYFIEEEYGFRHWIWFDKTKKFNKDKLNEYAKISIPSERHFPGNLSQVIVTIFRDPSTKKIHYFNYENLDQLKVKNEEEIKTAAYGIKTDSGYKFFFAEDLPSFGIDCADD